MPLSSLWEKKKIAKLVLASFGNLSFCNNLQNLSGISQWNLISSLYKFLWFARWLCHAFQKPGPFIWGQYLSLILWSPSWGNSEYPIFILFVLIPPAGIASPQRPCFICKVVWKISTFSEVLFFKKWQLHWDIIHISYIHPFKVQNAVVFSYIQRVVQTSSQFKSDHFCHSKKKPHTS